MLMWALNRVYDTEESRGFLRQRLVGLVMVAVGVVAFLLVFGLLVLGPKLSGWVESSSAPRAPSAGRGCSASGRSSWSACSWRSARCSSSGLTSSIHGGASWSGAGLAVALWLLASGGFAIYLAFFGSYNKTWGSLAAVIIMLTWLWLSSLALLFAAEVDAEAERTREAAGRGG